LTEDLPSHHEDRQPSPPSVPVQLPADSKQSSDLHTGPPLDTDNSPAAALQESLSQDAGEFNSVAKFQRSLSMFIKFLLETLTSRFVGQIIPIMLLDRCTDSV
jgi:hypothetical protein